MATPAHRLTSVVESSEQGPLSAQRRLSSSVGRRSDFDRKTPLDPNVWRTYITRCPILRPSPTSDTSAPPSMASSLSPAASTSCYPPVFRSHRIKYQWVDPVLFCFSPARWGSGGPARFGWRTMLQRMRLFWLQICCFISRRFSRGTRPSCSDGSSA